MRRDSRNSKQLKNIDNRIIIYTAMGVALLAVIVFGLLIYSKSLNESVREGTLSTEKIATLVNNAYENTQSVSTSMGKTVEEQKESLSTNIISNNTSDTSSTSQNASSTTSTNLSNNSSNTNSNIKQNNTIKENTSSLTNNQSNAVETSSKEEESTQKELNFEKPVEGEIVREFAKDNLIYSQTLEEWVTHTGIDIKADKTSVVKAAEDGTVKTIKNDPRYGLTIVIEHENGFQTVYSNLLTSEFVVEKEQVKKGQSIGTVGNTAVFEISDEPHLHFEILKDSIQVDPSLYLK